MCGRFTLFLPTEVLIEVFHLREIPPQSPRYNIAPTQQVPVILANSNLDSRQFKTMRWGLIPSWSKDAKIGTRLINARAETAMEKPSFRSAFRHRRCLILANGFYEWQRQEKGKQPFYFQMMDEQPFAFAGLWETWQNPQGETIESCTLLTTQANELMASIHDRMPVILDGQDYDRWLDPEIKQSETVRSLLQPYPADRMKTYPVTPKVNSPKNDTPECIQKIEITP